jgi:hypothetical protein
MSLPLMANCDLLQFAFALSKIKRTFACFRECAGPHDRCGHRVSIWRLLRISRTAKLSCVAGIPKGGSQRRASASDPKRNFPIPLGFGLNDPLLRRRPRRRAVLRSHRIQALMQIEPRPSDGFGRSLQGARRRLVTRDICADRSIHWRRFEQLIARGRRRKTRRPSSFDRPELASAAHSEHHVAICRFTFAGDLARTQLLD